MSFRVFGVGVEISPLFLGYVAFLCLLSDNNAALSAFACMLAHETGHLAAMAVFGEIPRRIRLNLGHFEITKSGQSSPGREAVVLLAGPLVNAGLALVFFLAGKQEICVITLALAVFNLIPALPLDGGRLLLLLLELLIGVDVAHRVSRTVTLCFSVALLAIGIVALIRFGSVFAVSVGFFLILSFFGG